eukprot:Sspe_Gene.77348::Locus_48318_Transcript_1_1_Confidence_1.000_Length_948::g.77348::m.77348
MRPRDNLISPAAPPDVLYCGSPSSTLPPPSPPPTPPNPSEAVILSLRQAVELRDAQLKASKAKVMELEARLSDTFTITCNLRADAIARENEISRLRAEVQRLRAERDELETPQLPFHPSPVPSSASPAPRLPFETRPALGISSQPPTPHCTRTREMLLNALERASCRRRPTSPASTREGLPVMASYRPKETTPPASSPRFSPPRSYSTTPSSSYSASSSSSSTALSFHGRPTM